MATPEPIRAALDHVRTIAPDVCMVLFCVGDGGGGMWRYMSADCKAPSLRGVNVDLLEAALDASYSEGWPCVFQVSDLPDEEEPDPDPARHPDA